MVSFQSLSSFTEYIYIFAQKILAQDLEAFMIAFCSAWTLLHNSYLCQEGIHSISLRQFPLSKQSFVLRGAHT